MIRLSESSDAAFAAGGFAVGMAAVLLIMLILTRTLMAAAVLPHPAILVSSLSVLTLLAIGEGLATDNDEAWTIAAAGIGALAGSVTAVFDSSKTSTKKEPQVDEVDGGVDEGG